MRFGYSLLIALLLASSAAADGYSSADGSSSVTFDAWARATPPGAGTGAVYGRIVNVSPAELVAIEISADVAAHIMVHETIAEDGMMRMRHSELNLAPGETLELAPGGRHIMLMGLQAGLKQGATWPLQIRWSDGSVGDYQVLVGTMGQLEAPDN